MIPISEYATVTLGTSLTDAVLALEKAQNAFTSSKYQHRAILVLDHDGSVVGKVGQLCALQAIEPEYNFNDKIEEIKKYNFSEEYLVRLRERYRSEETVLETDHLQDIAEKKVEEFMQKPRPGEFVAENGTIDTAIHRLVSGRHQSLLVTRQKRIIGILRMADVFAAVSHEIHNLAD
ncbi:MAG: CBS domain-containing protein [Deltaproteobacteria bacterium]|nr:CBS domain-containing protein [Deltaproteobacteria bacterium]